MSQKQYGQPSIDIHVDNTLQATYNVPWTNTGSISNAYFWSISPDTEFGFSSHVTITLQKSTSALSSNTTLNEQDWAFVAYS